MNLFASKKKSFIYRSSSEKIHLFTDPSSEKMNLIFENFFVDIDSLSEAEFKIK